MTQKPKIMIDLDGTIVDFHGPFMDFVSMETNYDYSASDLDGLNVPYLQPQTVERLHEQFIACGGYQTLPLFPNVPSTIAKLAETYQIIFCTARPQELRDTTETYLKDRNLLHTLWFHPSDKKVQVCQENDIGAIVEDNFGILQQASRTDLKVFGMSRQHNYKKLATLSGIIPLTNFKDILKYL